MVPGAGVEPAWPKPRDFKSLVSTYFTTWAGLSYRSGINNHLSDAKTIKKEGDSLICPSDHLTINIDFI